MPRYTLIKLLPSYLITWCENLITRRDEVPCTNIGNMDSESSSLSPSGYLVLGNYSIKDQNKRQ